MRLVVVGAGTVGTSLTDLALKAGHDVVVIEPDPDRAAACAGELDARIIHGGISDADIAEEAGLAEAGALVATTGDDAVNLMAAFLAREAGVKRITCIANHPAHRALFEQIGARVLVDPEVLVAQHLLDVTQHPEVEDLTTLQDREQVMEVTVGPEAEVAGKNLAALEADKVLGERLFLISVRRGGKGERFFPTPETELAPGDHVLVLSRHTITPRDIALFTGPATS